jgi:hypothetical protein
MQEPSRTLEFSLKGDAAMIQVIGQIMFVGLLIGVVGAIWMVLLDRH